MATDWQACGRGKCAAQDGHPGTCDEASGWAEDVTDWQARAEAAEARVRAVEELADEWATEGPSLIRHAHGAREVHEGATLEGCAVSLRAALAAEPTPAAEESEAPECGVNRHGFGACQRYAGHERRPCSTRSATDATHVFGVDSVIGYACDCLTTQPPDDPTGCYCDCADREAMATALTMPSASASRGPSPPHPPHHPRRLPRVPYAATSSASCTLGPSATPCTTDAYRAAMVSERPRSYVNWRATSRPPRT